MSSSHGGPRFAGSGRSNAARRRLNSGQDKCMHKDAGTIPAWSSGRGKTNQGSSLIEVKGFKELRISSGPSQSSTSGVNIKGRVQPMNTSFRPRRNGFNQDRNNHAWQSGFQARGNWHGPAGWHQQSSLMNPFHSSTGMAADSSMQGRGRGRGLAQDRNNHAWQSGFQAMGNWHGPAGWYQQSSSMNSFHHSPRLAADSSMQGRGRGRN